MQCHVSGFSWRRFMILVVLAETFRGCTFVGLGVGAAIPRSRDVPKDEWASLGYRSHVELEVEGQVYGGRFRQIWEGRVFVETSQGVQSFSLERIDEVETRTGTYWATGLVIGLLVDALLAAVIVDGFSSL